MRINNEVIFKVDGSYVCTAHYGTRENGMPIIGRDGDFGKIVSFDCSKLIDGVGWTFDVIARAGNNPETIIATSIQSTFDITIPQGCMNTGGLWLQVRCIKGTETLHSSVVEFYVLPSIAIQDYVTQYSHTLPSITKYFELDGDNIEPINEEQDDFCGVDGEHLDLKLSVVLDDAWHNLGCLIECENTTTGAKDIGGVRVGNIVTYTVHGDLMRTGGLNFHVRGTDGIGIRKSRNHTDLRIENSFDVVSSVPPLTPMEYDTIIGNLGILQGQFADLQSQLDNGDFNEYVYFGYSENSDGTNFTNVPTVGRDYIGVYSGSAKYMPLEKTAYTWSKYKGEKGAKGDTGEKGDKGNPAITAGFMPSAISIPCKIGRKPQSAGTIIALPWLKYGTINIATMRITAASLSETVTGVSVEHTSTYINLTLSGEAISKENFYISATVQYINNTEIEATVIIPVFIVPYGESTYYLSGLPDTINVPVDGNTLSVRTGKFIQSLVPVLKYGTDDVSEASYTFDTANIGTGSIRKPPIYTEYSYYTNITFVELPPPDSWNFKISALVGENIVASKTIRICFVVDGEKGDTGAKGDTGEVTQAELDSAIQSTNLMLALKQSTTDNSLQTNAKTIVGAINELRKEFINKYTVNFTSSLSAGTRADDAVGMVANVAVGAEYAINSFDNVSFYNRPICCCTWDTTARKWRVNAYRGEPGFAWDGTNGELMYECTPFYLKTDLNTYASVTATPCEGYTLAPMFRDGVTKEYRPVFPLAMVGGVATSRSGYFPQTGSLNSFMVNCRTFDSKAHTETIEDRFSDYVLQLVEFATKDVQSVMMGACNMRYNGDDTIIEYISDTSFTVTAGTGGLFKVGQTISIGTTQNGEQLTRGVVIKSITQLYAISTVVLESPVVGIEVGNYISSRAWINGATNIVTASSGSPVSNTDGYYPCIWRGNALPWGNGFSTLSNMLIERTGEGTTESPYVCTPHYLPEPWKYANGAITADYIKANYTIPNTNGYVKTLGADTRYPFVMCTKEIGGTATTYAAAFYNFPAVAATANAVRVGGGFRSGAKCSPVYFETIYPPSSANLDYTARLFVSP